ncbi:MAG TPA: ABC transporter permease [Dehalococcoidales bacterium]|nr:ABC transporter permease [Dehalococcoidales bacterium]
MNKKPIFLAILVLLFIWVVVSLAVQKPILPPPWKVFYAFFIDLPQGLGWHILVSSWRILLAMLAATLIGVPLGLWLGHNRLWDKYFYPLVYVTYPIPKITLLPIIILFLGIGDVSKIFLISLILVFQVLVITRDTSRNIPAEYVLSLRSLGANRWHLLRYVYLPACLPSTLTALRLNVAVSIAVLYLAESFATVSGLGFYIMDTWQRLDYSRMYAGVLAMSLIGASAFIILAETENRFCRWTQVGKHKHSI